MTIDLRNSTDFEVLRAAKVLARIAEVARGVGVDFLVVGAMARTIISVGLLGTVPERRTKDIDIATEVGSWEDFERLAKRFDERKGTHKFVIAGTEVDVVPYGGVERADRTILWPDDHQMNVLGLREAVDSAVTVLMPDGVTVQVPSIPALALLKLFAWRDRHRVDTRDAIDLVVIINWYSSGHYWDRLYDEEFDILERFGHDPRVAGAALLGRHMSDLLGDQAVAVLVDVVDNEDLMGRLARDMAAVRAAELVTAMGDGIRDAVAERRSPERR
ncbi:nucleotidyl transferase AbiEii/AbiGii toxin family protein [Saccharothrix sp. NRRL B-16348]|uniref:nucleotidyl transferase AbiEii/AbiGii toxin family protein n=1 Tax=Saccharothrix sp. NRRL B-16348 TaxID=1415542 RepID=UPI0006AE8119|nr:nucleotidyl transferase AbiEii/AbiGii toxin family protein [Saccharothrix sp. NRRL B-16348]